MKEIKLTQGKVALVDDEDFERVSASKWHAVKSPRNFYAARNIGKAPNQKTIFLHGDLLDIRGVDHKNGDGLDCRRENLRPATKQQNSCAFRCKRLGASSQFRGVSWFSETLKWRAQIQKEGQKVSLGLFKLEKDAAMAYDNAAIEMGFFKEALNFPERYISTAYKL